MPVKITLSLIVIVRRGIRTGLSGNLGALHTLTRPDQAPGSIVTNVQSRESAIKSGQFSGQSGPNVRFVRRSLFTLLA